MTMIARLHAGACPPRSSSGEGGPQEIAAEGQSVTQNPLDVRSEGPGNAPVRYLEALAAATERLEAGLLAHARSGAPPEHVGANGELFADTVALLTSHQTVRIAQFFFCANELRLGESDRFAAFVGAHNRRIDGLIASPHRLRQTAVSAARLRAGRFSDEQVRFVAFMSPPGEFWLDQSSLGRFLVEAMAPESCRKCVVTLAEFGLITRRDVGHKLIRSPGTLEALYATYLETILGAVTERG